MRINQENVCFTFKKGKKHLIIQGSYDTVLNDI